MKIYKFKSIEDYLASRENEKKELITAIGLSIVIIAIILKVALS